MKKYIIYFNDKKIEYSVIRRKVKNVRLKVKSDLSVEVVANKAVPLSFINDFVEKNANWVFSTTEKIKSKSPLQNFNFEKDDTVYFLGKAYKLDIIEASKNSIILKDDKIVFNLKSDDFDNFELKSLILDKWYKEQAQIIYSARLTELLPLMHCFNIDHPSLKLRKMKSCWGTCHYTKNLVVLNTLLVKYPIECIDYVILHELVHFIHHNHSKDFYLALETVCPNWKELKAKLKINL